MNAYQVRKARNETLGRVLHDRYANSVSPLFGGYGFGALWVWPGCVSPIFIYPVGQIGESEEGSEAEVKGFSVQVFGQTKLLKDKKSGIMHIVIFYGFIILQLGALDLILKGLIDRGLPVPGYDYFTLMQEVTVG